MYLEIGIELFLSLGTLISLAGKHFGFPIWIFWVWYIALILYTTHIIIRGSTLEKRTALFMLTLVMSLIFMVAYPYSYQIGLDDVFEAEAAYEIVENGGWSTTLGAGFAESYYTRNPAIHLILAALSMETGIPTHPLIKYFFIILLRTLTIAVGFLICKAFFGERKLTYLATLLFIVGSGMAFTTVTRRSFASLFFLFSFYALIKVSQSKRSVWIILFVMMSALTVLSDHTISLYFILFLGGATVSSWLAKITGWYRPIKGIWIFLVISLCFYLLWELIIAQVFVQHAINYLSDIMTLFLSFNLSEIIGGSTSSGHSTSIYRSYELLTIYSTQLLLLLLSSIGCLILLRSNWKKKSDFILPYFIIVGILSFVVSAVLMKTEYDVAVIIFMWFGGLAMSISIAYLFRNLEGKVVQTTLCVLVLFLAIGTMFMGIYTPRITNRGTSEDIDFEYDPRSKTVELYSSAEWLSQVNPDANLIGDLNVFELYSGMFGFDVNTYPYWVNRIYSGNATLLQDVIYNQGFDYGTYPHIRRQEKLDYIIINSAMTRYYSKILQRRATPSDIIYLDSLHELNKVYTNTEVHIYST